MRGHRNFHWYPKEVLKVRQCVARLEFLWEALERSIMWSCKLSLSWHEDSRNMGYLPRKAIGNEQSQPSREVICAATSKARGAGLVKCVRVHIIPLHVADATQGARGFNVYSLGAWFCCGSIHVYVFFTTGMAMYILWANSKYITYFCF